MNRRNRRAAAPPSKGSAKASAKRGPEASSNDPRASASAACEAGVGHLRAGRYLDAQIACQQALAAAPDHADSLHLMGLLSGQAQNHDLAVEWIARAIRQDPKAEYLSSLGGTLRQQERFEEALKAYDKAVQLKPEDLSLWINLGTVLSDLARLDEALLAFQHVFKLDSRHWDAAYRCGFILERLGRSAEALTYFDLSDTLKPNHAPIVQMRAVSLLKLKRFDEALAGGLRAYALEPGRPDTCNNIGAILQSLRRDEEALVWFDKALALKPDYMTVLSNKASSLQQVHRFEEAAATYRHMKTIDPGYALADWDLALIDMRAGNFEAGWAGREARWKAHKVNYPQFSQPMWLGAEDIAGKTILICSDEGLGDSIQFARYVPMVAARGARVILVVTDAAYSLLSDLPGVSECFRKSDTVFPPFDMHCATSSLPLAFATTLDTIPADIPYLPAPAPSRMQAWEDRLGPRSKLRVGLVWSGNPIHSNDHNRSVPFQTFSRLFDADATFVSLQKDARPDDKTMLRECPDIIDLTAELTDFNETAALIACLDLVITVDTSVAHLAGALGCPTWILLPYTPDYRWLLDRDDSPWYPTVRLFRQTAARDYAEVLDRVRAELVALCAERNPDAQISRQQAPDLDGDDADSLHRMGVQFLQAGQYDQAMEWITRAIRQDPKAEYLSSLGGILREQGRFEKALKAYDKAVQLKPEDAGLWHRLGNILLELKRLDHALLSFAHALELDPRHQDAAFKSGVLLHHMGRFDESIARLDLCDALLPNHAPTLQARARTLFSLKRFEEALAENRRAHTLDPGNADTCNNIGVCLQSLGREEEALSWFDSALDLLPNTTEILNNKGLMLSQLQRFDEAFALYDQVRALQLNDATADWNLALLQMLTGNFEAGWAGREARWRKSDAPPYPKFSQPMWLGKESIEGKTILVHVDEGAGDTIQFVRYVPMLAGRGARIVLVVERHLHSLMSSLPGIEQCLSFPKDPLPAFDMHCPIGSLPLVFGTRLDSIPSATSYLPSPAEARVQFWEARLVREAGVGPHDRPRVGLVWSGNPSHRNDANRSTSLRLMSRLLDVDATFVSLQKDPKPEDKAVLAQTGIIDLTAELTDFNETAALISCLDLVITVDTSVAHLAGALGCPTWILLPYTPDYRWLLDRDDSPWYPTVRLFRQTATRDYAEVLDRVRAELVALCAERNPDAQISRQQAPDPYDADSLHRMGMQFLQAGQYDQAMEWIARAIRQDPKAEYLSSLGGILREQGRFEEALKAYDKAVQLRPEDTSVWINLGNVLADLVRLDEALLAFQHVLKLNMRHWDAAFRCGFILEKLGRYTEALTYFHLGDALQPNHAHIVQMRAMVLQKMKRFEEALPESLRAYELDPGRADTCNNIGAIMQSFGRDEEALMWIDKALALQPDYTPALTNKANSLQQFHRFDEAVAIYRQIKTIDPGHALADWDLALIDMRAGNFEAGWAGREARWKAHKINYPKFSQPVWLGQENIAGKTILICSDEGLGDSIQFARYVPMVAARGARVILVVDDAAYPLLSALPGVSESFRISDKVFPAFDMHCPTSSLPLAFATRLDTIPADIPYLPLPAQDRVQAWEDRLGPRSKLRVGLVWSGNPLHSNDHNRSVPLQTFSRILDADATFVSLQKGAKPADQAVLAQTGIIDLTAELTDFNETAALIACLDLVITVDTSVAHLAGALGRPTWILLPYTPDYRWLLDRDDSPWYPTMRLFRQTAARDYAEVLDRVRGELVALCGGTLPVSLKP